MVAHLSGPLATGAEDTEIVIDGTGEARIDWSPRYPLLTLALRAPLRGTAAW